MLFLQYDKKNDDSGWRVESMNRAKRQFCAFLSLLFLLIGSLFSGCMGQAEDTAADAVSISIVDASQEPQRTNEEDSSETAELQAANEDSEQTEEQDREIPRQYFFRNAKLLAQHYEKHGIEMGFASEEEYEAAASDVINNPSALHKKEKEDNDEVYYVEDTNEFAVLSEDGYIRTYFNPGAGIRYYERQ